MRRSKGVDDQEAWIRVLGGPLLVFYCRVCLGIPLGREMIVGDRCQEHDGTSNTMDRQIRATDVA